MKKSRVYHRIMALVLVGIIALSCLSGHGKTDVVWAMEITGEIKTDNNQQMIAQSFELDDLSLDKLGEKGSIFTQNRDRDIAYLKLLDRDRMLYNFYKNYGETKKIENLEPLGGWEEQTGLLRGHSTGRYMSALALAYNATHDAEIKENLDYVVHELSRMQEKSSGDAAAFTSRGSSQEMWSTDPTEWGEGYIGAYPPDQFALLEKYAEYGEIWAPYYTLHKLLAGFLDAYTYTGNEEALEAAEKLGKWVYNRLKHCSQKQLTKMWDMYVAGEFGSCNESMAQLYIYTGDELFLEGAKLFDNTNFFTNMAKNIDDISGRHANQHVSQVIGALKIYEATVKKGEGEQKYYDIAKNFWHMATEFYAFSTGGVDSGEGFTTPYRQANSINGTTNGETCVAYNMMKLTRMLNNYDPDNAAYMDYYERVLYNHILATQNPNVTEDMHNGTTFTMPIGPGEVRSYGGDYTAFTCCFGTGMECPVRYQEAAYAKTEDTLYVGLYLPSSVNWREKGLKIKQETTFPSENTTLKVSALNEEGEASSVCMKLRVPYFATKGFTVRVNGETKITNPDPCSYVELQDIHAGDTIEINMPWVVHLDRTPDTLKGAEVASVMYGPFVMAAQIDSKSWKTLIVSKDLSEGVKISKEESSGFPKLEINGYSFAPMFDEEFASKPYHTYFKIREGDMSCRWYEAEITNETPERGEIALNQDMVKEGDNVEVTAKADSGYVVRAVLANGVEVLPSQKDSYIIENVKEDLQIEVVFQKAGNLENNPENLEYLATVSSDYTASWEKLSGIQTDWEPEQSNAGIGKGWGNWPQEAGSEHYVQYEWEQAVEMNCFDIYWYDDGGDTAVPGSVKVMYKNTKGSWEEAQMLTDYKEALKTDQYNTIKIKPVKATAVKLVMTVKSGKAANGILRWKVSNTQDTKTDSDKNVIEYLAEAFSKLFQNIKNIFSN